jgi:hypothetical protein
MIDIMFNYSSRMIYNILLDIHHMIEDHSSAKFWPELAQTDHDYGELKIFIYLFYTFPMTTFVR